MLRFLVPTKKKPCNLTCCKTGWNVGGDTRNIAINLFRSNVAKAVARFWFPILL